MDFRWHYVDDSGAPQTGWIVYGYIQLGASEWNAALGRWLSFRRFLYRDYSIPTDYELHSRDFINGRGNPSQLLEWNRVKTLRREVTTLALETIGAMPGVRVGAAWRHTKSRRNEYAVERQKTYSKLLQDLTTTLEKDGEYGAVVVDGTEQIPPIGKHIGD